MNTKIVRTFSVFKDIEDPEVVFSQVEKEAYFKGTNLYVLFFAILIASLGLNLNSTAVVIGAMLISPLMGPIVGAGVAVAVNDVGLLKRAGANYFFAFGVGLFASTLYFLVTPLNAAQTEILARTSPTVYDALIALFGGFAGILAVSSKQKGNVIPGVAIATALMPPLCTAGYGLATWQLEYFVGALYLYIINSVFISTATVITVYLLKFPRKQFADKAVRRRTLYIVWTVAIATLLPSIYLAYKTVEENQFKEKAERFIKTEAVFPNTYLLQHSVDANRKSVSLTFGGSEITDSQINVLKRKLGYYQLSKIDLQIKQGFAFLPEDNSKEVNSLGLALNQSEEKNRSLQKQLDSISTQQQLGDQIFKEISAQYPQIKQAILQPVTLRGDSSVSEKQDFLALLYADKPLSGSERTKLEKWLKVRLNNDSLRIMYDK